MNQEDPLRGTGRSTNIVLKAVRDAIDQAGRPLLVHDHFNNRMSHERTRQKVGDILRILGVDHDIDDAGAVTVYPRKKKDAE